MEPQRNEEETKMSSKPNYRKWTALAGAFLIFFPEHFVNIWGNLTVYVTSYFLDRYGTTSVESPWTITIFSIAKNIGVSVPGYLTCVGRKTRIFWALIVFNIAMSSMHFILEEGASNLLFVAFGVIGFCCGIVDSGIFKILSEISGSSKGTYMSIACSGFNFGPFVINLLVGFYMNPTNLSPNVNVDNMVLFGQTELIDKTPSMLIILAVLSAVSMFTGFCLLSFSVPSQPPSQIQDETVYRTFSNEDNVNQTASPVQENYDRTSMNKNIILNSTNGSSTHSVTPNEEDNTTIGDPGVNDSNINNEEREFTPLETIKYIPFHVISFSFGSTLFGYVLMNNWYKTYGLLYIKNDNLLTQLGSFFSLGGGITRIIWGFALDKFSMKNNQIIMCSYLSLTILVMYFSAHVNDYMYFIVTLLVSFGTNIALPTFLMICLTYFGEEHFYKNYGVLCLTRACYSIIIAPLFETLRGNFGWFGPFCCTSAFTTVSLILTVLFVPDIVKRQKK